MSDNLCNPTKRDFVICGKVTIEEVTEPGTPPVIPPPVDPTCTVLTSSAGELLTASTGEYLCSGA